MYVLDFIFIMKLVVCSLTLLLMSVLQTIKIQSRGQIARDLV